jgi:hypothetical protein
VSRLPEAMAYFREEMVRTLAGGDEGALGAPWA